MSAVCMFSCDKCGLCCRQVGNVTIGKNMALPNGICKYLNQETNLCNIYDKRPIICNVDKYYKMYMEDIMNKDDYYKLNKNVCDILKRCDLNKRNENCAI